MEVANLTEPLDRRPLHLCRHIVAASGHQRGESSKDEALKLAIPIAHSASVTLKLPLFVSLLTTAR